MATKTLKELALSRGPEFDDYAKPEDRAALLKAPRESHNGAYSCTFNPQAMVRAAHIESLLNGRLKPFNEKSSASIKALKTFLETYQLDFKKMARYWNGTAGSAYPRVILNGEVVPLYCQQVWTLAERFAHKVGQIWSLEVKADSVLERTAPLDSVAKPQPAPARKVEISKPKAESKAEPKGQDFKAVIAAMKKAGVSADLILKTLESL